jgi:hypothetical protein
MQPHFHVLSTGAVEKTTVSVQASYEKMRDALNKTGRPILYSLCSWGSGQPWLWGKDVSGVQCKAGLQGCIMLVATLGLHQQGSESLWIADAGRQLMENGHRCVCRWVRWVEVVRTSHCLDYTFASLFWFPVPGDTPSYHPWQCLMFLHAAALSSVQPGMTLMPGGLSCPASCSQ